MANFDVALAYVLEQEGGFVNNPSDKGLATNYGISSPTLSKWLGRAVAVDDVKNISMQTVKAIYRKNYWDVIKGDALTQQSSATFLMDMAVLMGPSSAARLAQTSLNLKADGLIGPVSIAKLNITAPSVFALVFSKLCVKAFVSIVVANPSQLVFLPNWVGRAHEMTDIGIA